MKRLIVVASLFVLCVACTSQQVTLEKGENEISVYIDGQLFTRYLTLASLTKPVLFPVQTPTGVKVNRSYPFENVEGESHDHPHHTGIFFTYDKVNGSGFWNNTKFPPQVQHLGIKEMQEGETGMLRTESQWVNNDEKPLLKEDRTMRFIPEDDAWAVEFDITLTALQDSVVFAPTKEGMFAIRVAHWLKEKESGTYLASTGKTGAGDIWGRRAKWVALQGEYENQPKGIAILNHPGSINYPTFWHARDYGLFAANPLGQDFFNEAHDVEAESFILKLAPGERAEFKFKVLVYDANFSQEKLKARFAEYAGQ